MRIRTEYFTEGKDDEGFLILPKEFSVNEWKFKQIKREGQIAMYFKANKERDFKESCIEVIIVQKYPAYEIAGNKMPAKENFCADELWGQFGWSYQSQKIADKKFNRLIKDEN